MATSRPDFDIVSFSQGVKKEISNELSRIPPQTQVASITVVEDLTSQAGSIIASPPLPPINANVNSIVQPLNALTKNPVGVVRGSLKTSLGRQSSQLRTGLLGLKSTLSTGIRTCLTNSILSLTNKIPNLPLGGIDIKVNAKLNDMLNLQLQLGLDLNLKRISAGLAITAKLDSIKNLKNLANLTGKMQGEVNKELNNICNQISPRNKKGFQNNRYMTNYVTQQVQGVMNCMEKKIVKATGGFDVTAPADFFDKVTGKILDPAAQVQGEVQTGLDRVTGTISGAIDSVDSAIAKTQGAVSSVLRPIGTAATEAVDTINRSINSNISKLLPDTKKCD